MKRLSNLLAALVFASLVIFMSCGGGGDDPAPSAGETQAGLLNGTWAVSGTPLFNNGVEGDWTGFTLTISGTAEGSDGIWGGNYSTSGTPTGYEAVWPTSGNWNFESTTVVNRAVRNDATEGVSVTINVSETGLTLTFTLTDPNARAAGIYGQEWTFQFTPQ